MNTYVSTYSSIYYSFKLSEDMVMFYYNCKYFWMEYQTIFSNIIILDWNDNIMEVVIENAFSCIWYVDRQWDAHCWSQAQIKDPLIIIVALRLKELPRNRWWVTICQEIRLTKNCEEKQAIWLHCRRRINWGNPF